jgi:glycosyltransferase involved in cell wall biosynthesis
MPMAMVQPILFMIQHLDHGGTEFHFRDLVTRIDRGRFEPHVIYSDGEVVSGQLRGLGWMPVTRMPITRAYDLSGMRAIWRVRRYVKEHRIAAVFCFHFVADFVGTLATIGLGGVNGMRGAGGTRGAPPVISSRRDMGFTRTSRQVRMGRWLDRRVARYIAVSEAVREAVAHDERVDPAKIEVIHNGLDLAAIDAQRWDLAAERRRHGIDEDALVIGCVANFNAVKRHVTLIEAFAKVAAERPEKNLRLLLTGDGPMRREIEGKIAELKMEGRVVLPGRSPQLTADYAVADVFVLPSETEGFSNAIVQAMLYRRPVVACRVGGNPEAIADGETGLLVEPRDAGAMAAALGRLVDDEAMRKRMGEAGRARAEKLFTLDAMIGKTETLIERVMGERK